MLLIQHEKYNTEKYNTEKYNTKKYSTHVQREVELYSPEISMMGKWPKQKYVDICPIPFNSYDLINAQLETTCKILAA